MKIYYDTEFIEDGHTIGLISIGMVADDGREYYAVVEDSSVVDRAVDHQWLRENVVPSLPVEVFKGADGTRWGWLWDASHPDIQHVKLRETIAEEVLDFLVPKGLLLGPGDACELWAWYGAYDHVALCQLFGAMIDLPPGIPMYTNDLKQECVRLGNPRMAEQAEGQHNALADARHNLKMAQALDALSRATVTPVDAAGDRDQFAWCWEPNPDGPLNCGRLANHDGKHKRGEREWD